MKRDYDIKVNYQPGNGIEKSINVIIKAIKDGKIVIDDKPKKIPA